MNDPDAERQLSKDKVKKLNKYGLSGDVYAEEMIVDLNEWYLDKGIYEVDNFPWWVHLKNKPGNKNKKFVDIIYNEFVQLKGGEYNGY